MYRMGDPSGECEIEEDTCYYSPQVNRTAGKVSWLLDKGWGIGKKILVTGAVISSAPFVLPPLVVTSAIAFACWVPSGVVLASYACSEKLMSKLLPYNSSSSTTEGVLMSNNEEEEFEYAEEGVEADVGEHLDVEEKPKWEGINGVKIEGSRDEYKDNVLLDENAASDGVEVLVFNVIEGEEEFGVTPIEVTSVVLEGSEGQEKVSDFVEEEGLVKETRGLLEEIRDEGNANNAGAMEKRYPGEIEQREEETDELIGSHVEETEGAVEKKITDADVGLEKPTGETEDGVPKESEEIEEMKHVRDANAVSEDRGSVSESKSADETFGAEKPIEEIKIVNNILEAEMPMAETRIGVRVVSTIVEEKHAPGINKEAVVQAGRAEHNINENVVSTNADAREIADESGLHLFDEKNVSGQQYYESEGEVDT